MAVCACGCGEILKEGLTYKNGGHAMRTKALPVMQRFEGKFVQSEGCWEWKGKLNNQGYGMFSVKQEDGTWKFVLAHRFAYEAYVGPIPTGMELDHTCENPPCIRPSHHEPVTHQVNIQRGYDSKRRRQSDG